VLNEDHSWKHFSKDIKGISVRLVRFYVPPPLKIAASGERVMEYPNKNKK
jgi:hypothetical protein